ncbi:MAG: SPOR domain-containing protein, partial [Alistipes sp.]|nr:SPOR domain-containing protein [Alistipes sp.]
MKRKFVLVGLAALFLGLSEVAAQDVVARVAGLEENKEYMDLLRSDEKLRQQTDSLMAVVREVRGAMRT